MDALAAQEGGDRTVAREISRMRNRDVFLKLRGKSIRNVSSHTYGILAWDDGFEVVAPLLLKNQEIPHKHVSGENGSSRFGTAEDNQASIEVVLLETDGDSLDPMYCKEIGRGTVEMPPGIPADSEVVVTFNYAADGTMTLHAREVTSNSNCEVRTTRAGVMDEVEVELAETHLAVLSTS
jgi:molecular chaperone DnaK (HSP70)